MSKKLVAISIVVVFITITAAVSANAGGNSCSVSGSKEGTSHDATVGEGWWVGDKDTNRIVEFWTNEPGHDQGARKVFLREGQKVPLLGGGFFWFWPRGCEQQAFQDFRSHRYSPVSLLHLAREGLIEQDLAPVG